MSAQSSRARANARRRQRTYSKRPYRRARSNGRGNGGYARRGYGRARHQSVKHPVMWAVFWTAVIVFMIGNNWLTITGK